MEINASIRKKIGKKKKRRREKSLSKIFGIRDDIDELDKVFSEQRRGLKKEGEGETMSRKAYSMARGGGAGI